MSVVKLDRLPEDVAAVVADVAEFLGVYPADLFVADHTHEELAAGAYSIALEGDHDWPYRFTEDRYEAARRCGRDAYYRTRHLEAGSGWYLAVFPVAELPRV